MPPDALSGFFIFLSSLSPTWGLAFLIAAILSWRSPEIIRELRRRRGR
jgi:hypothetical protein